MRCGEITVVKTAFYSELEKITQAQLARVLMGRASRIAGGKMLAEAAGFEAWDRLTDEQAQDFKSAASIMMGQMGVETHAKALALKRGVEWGKLDLVGRAEMVSAAMSKLGHIIASPPLPTQRPDSVGDREGVCTLCWIEPNTDIVTVPGTEWSCMFMYNGILCNLQNCNDSSHRGATRVTVLLHL